MSKSVKTGKNKSKTNTGYSETNPTMFAMGYVDLIFKLNLTDKDLEKPPSEENSGSEEKKNEEDKYYKLEDLNSIKDLNFLKDKKELWDKIILSGGNHTLKQLIIGNKTSKKKCRIEYIGYGIPKFEGENEFCRNNKLLGEFYLNNITKAKKGVPKIKVKFDIDEDSILHVTAKETISGSTNSIDIKCNKGIMQQDDINKMIKKLQNKNDFEVNKIDQEEKELVEKKTC